MICNVLQVVTFQKCNISSVDHRGVLPSCQVVRPELNADSIPAFLTIGLTTQLSLSLSSERKMRYGAREHDNLARHAVHDVIAASQPNRSHTEAGCTAGRRAAS